MRRVVISMSKHAISNEKESVGAIIKKFMHVIGINHRLCKWILPCNLGKNIIMAGLPYVGIVYGCNILNALVAREAKGHIMNMVYQLLVITFAMTLLYHILDKAGNAMRDNIRYRIKADISSKAASLDYQDLESQDSMQLLTAALEGEKESGGIYWFSDKLGVLIGDVASIFYAFVVLVPILTQQQHLTGNGVMQILNSKWIIYLIFLLNLFSMFLFMWISKKGNKKQYEIYEESLDAIRKDDYFYREILSKYATGKEIRLYALKDLLLRDMTKVWDEKCNIQDRKLDIQEKIRIRYLIVQALLLVISYTVIGVRGVNGMITGAEVVKYVSALTALGGACQYMVDHFETVLLNMQYLHHYYEYLQLPNRKQTGGKPTADLPPQDLVITFEDVSFKYPGGKKDSLEHVNLTFHYGEKIALVGPNGAGKTTLILLLCRLYEPTHGRILLNGIDIREYDYEEYLAMFGVVFQDFKLFSVFGKANLLVKGRATIRLDGNGRDEEQRAKNHQSNQRNHNIHQTLYKQILRACHVAAHTQHGQMEHMHRLSTAHNHIAHTRDHEHIDTLSHTVFQDDIALMAVDTADEHALHSIQQTQVIQALFHVQCHLDIVLF